MAPVRTYRLFELNEHLRRVVALNFQEPLWVECELAQVGLSRGHYYLSLIEKEAEEGTLLAQLDGVIWQRTYKSLYRKIGPSLTSLLQDGMEVKLKVRLEFNERYGLKLMVEDIDPTYTLGKLELKRQQTLERLQKEGRLGKNANVPLPPVVQRIAVISSERAAGYLDYTRQLENNVYGYQFVSHFFGAAMQGDRVEAELLDQLKVIAKRKSRYDCVVIIRGGGARLDLSAFDSYAIAAAIADFPLPVLTGIGHEVDDVVVDRVAHRSLKTPTAVAEFLVQHNMRFEATIQQMGLLIQRLSQQQLHLEQSRLQQLEQTIRFSTEKQLLANRHLLEQMQRQLVPTARFQLEKARALLDRDTQLLQLLEPAATLKRGYSITEANDKITTQTKDLQPGTTIKTHLTDGIVTSTISDIEKQKDNEN